jgi:PPOX class probable F420-dependent enzyme
MPKLTNDEVESFLQERGHLARIATLKDDGSPSVVPVWFICEEGKIIITPRKYSAFYAHIQRDPRVAISIDEQAGRYRKVLVESTADIVYPIGHDDEWRDLYRRISCRYVDEASADYYISETIDQPRALIGVALTKAKLTTWRMPREDEPYSGIWHRRYYEADSKMAAQARMGASPAGGDKLKLE